MVSKKISDFPKNKVYNKYLFAILIFLYGLGLCVGCLFTFKNGENLNYVVKVTGTSLIENLVKSDIIKLCFKFFIRDSLALCLILILKYSGVLKSLCSCIPLAVAIQNASIYCNCFISQKLNIIEIFVYYIVKDAAVAFLILMYTTIILHEILSKKENLKQDLKTLSVYVGGVAFIYIIDYAIKLIII